MGINWKGVVNSVLPGSTYVVDYFKDAKDYLDGSSAMRKQNQANIDNWNTVNAYNTPSAQMQRFKESGLNPNLIYTQSNTASNIASAGMPESGASVLGKAASAFNAVMGLKQMAANIANLHQQNENLKSQDSLLHSQTEFTNAQADRYRYETAEMKNRGMISQDNSWVKLFDVVGGRAKEAFRDFDSQMRGVSNDLSRGRLPGASRRYETKQYLKSRF